MRSCLQKSKKSEGRFSSSASFGATAAEAELMMRSSREEGGAGIEVDGEGGEGGEAEEEEEEEWGRPPRRVTRARLMAAAATTEEESDYAYIDRSTHSITGYLNARGDEEARRRTALNLSPYATTELTSAAAGRHRRKAAGAKEGQSAAAKVG